MLRRSLKFYLCGLIAGPILINFIAFGAPFWIYSSGIESYNVREVVNAIQPLSIIASIFYFLALYNLSIVETRNWIRALCLCFSMVTVISSVYGLFPTGEATRILLTPLHGISKMIMLLLGVIVLLPIVGDISDNQQSESVA